MLGAYRFVVLSAKSVKVGHIIRERWIIPDTNIRREYEGRQYVNVDRAKRDQFRLTKHVIDRSKDCAGNEYNFDFFLGCEVSSPESVGVLKFHVGDFALYIRSINEYGQPMITGITTYDVLDPTTNKFVKKPKGELKVGDIVRHHTVQISPDLNKNAGKLFIIDEFVDLGYVNGCKALDYFVGKEIEIVSGNIDIKKNGATEYFDVAMTDEVTHLSYARKGTLNYRKTFDVLTPNEKSNI